MRKNYRFTQRSQMHGQEGFTLIELSIVIVVIGLLVGGVLVGQDLIKMSEARSLMGQMEKFQIAANAFQLKYSCKAGDCNRASRFGLGPNGNGDGKLSANVSYHGSYRMYYHWNNTTLGELQYFWVHLSRGELLNKAYGVASGNMARGADPSPYFPKDQMGKAFLTPTFTDQHTYIATGFTKSDGYFKHTFRNLVLTAPQAQYIHSKANGHANLNIVPNDPRQSFDTNDRMHPTAEKWVSQGITEGSYYQNDSRLSIPGNRCVVGSSGAYRYSDDGFCNILWKLDY